MVPKMKKFLLIFSIFYTSIAFGQQTSDSAFNFAIPSPSYQFGSGPIVCIDAAHFNFHTAEGRYNPFAEILISDGFKVESLQSIFTESLLEDCSVLVIANALAEQNRNDWSYPHPSAFQRDEIQTIQRWVSNGGNLLLVADHAPFAGAAADLAAVFGVVMIDVYSIQTQGATDIFSKAQNTLLEHPISVGRNNENIESLATFTGQAFRAMQEWSPLMIFGAGSLAYINPQQTFQESDSSISAFPINGWIHAAAREMGQGRIVILGEAAMCSAQLSGNGNLMGMNHPMGGQNAQFCLNSVRWLSRLLN